MTRYDKLVNTEKKVFNVDDLVSVWELADRRDALESIKGYVRRGKLKNPYKGIYQLGDFVDRLELAQKLYPPSYISYFTALAFHGIVFQFYNDIHLMGVNSKKISIGNDQYIFHKLKEEVLFMQVGLDYNGKYTIATPERAITDSLYLNKNIAFDNLSMINNEKLLQISEIYKNKRVEMDVKNLIADLKEA